MPSTKPKFILIHFNLGSNKHLYDLTGNCPYWYTKRGCWVESNLGTELILESEHSVIEADNREEALAIWKLLH